MNERVKKWLDIEKKPEDYDFVEDTVSGDELTEYQKQDILRKFFLYKVDTTHMGKMRSYANDLESNYDERFIEFIEFSKLLGLQDPDSHSELLQGIYKILWPTLVDKPFMINSDGNIASDTMTSAQTSVTAATNTKNNEYQTDESFKIIYKADPKQGKKVPWNKGITTNVGIELAANENTTHFCEKLRKTYPDLESFIKSYHTIGNYCPVPVGCNGPRGKGPTKDYWDLALLAIYKYYMGNGEANISEMLQKKEAETKRYLKWLDSFGSWDEFVKANYMQAFVGDPDPKKDQEFGCPKELWDGHFAGKVLPEVNDKQNQFEEFFSNAAAWISARGKQMVEELREKVQA